MVKYRNVPQSIESSRKRQNMICNQAVVGSNPTTGTNDFKGLAVNLNLYYAYSYQLATMSLGYGNTIQF
jgi:hypothetical protein